MYSGQKHRQYSSDSFYPQSQHINLITNIQVIINSIINNNLEKKLNIALVSVTKNNVILFVVTVGITFNV